jgi:activator of HSP90 ATPase
MAQENITPALIEHVFLCGTVENRNRGQMTMTTTKNSCETDPVARLHTFTRRAFTGVALTFGGLALTSTAWGSTQEPVKEIPSTPANAKRTSLHQEVDLKANPQRIYETLLDSKQFSACTGMPAEIDPKAGGAFSMFGGMIVGRTIELIPNQRIVQAWRPTHWDQGVYSLVRFELKPRAPGATIVLDHSSFPEGDYDSLSSGWESHYWTPLKKLS